ncbi:MULTISPECIES: hypothetical protein [unclassified Micromonospora]|uniref:hypothetical protein n=1 Tax=unclassified Micromonospora TaxID=2617518 RepID=UPI001C21B6A9|nr:MULTISPECIES: hypothetical protein [unclassified Micromonospora]MBU8859482.1 hypothetical protein [Micromonospora sp. WMMB482]MDM4778995.1 hypothetical protein [Micromonospora sp. b486]
MSTENGTSPPGPDPYAVATRGEQVQLPSWMTGADAQVPLTRAERFRLVWSRQRGKRHVALVVVLALALIGGTAVLGRVTVDRVRGGTAAAASAEASPSPVPLSRVGEPRNLFAGTLGADFAVGEAGIVLPQAAARPPFTAREVGAALTQVRAAVIQARLDLSMILGDTEPFLALLAPASRAQLRTDFEDSSFLNYATRIGSQDSADEIRVRGEMRYRTVTGDDGRPILRITTEYVWMYAFDVPRTTPGRAGIATIRDRVVWEVPHSEGLPAAKRGLWLVSAQASTNNVDCARLGEGFFVVEPWMGGAGSFQPC